MKSKLQLILTVLLCSVFVIPAIGQNSVITYQGRFAENGQPFKGQVEFQFTLWDAESDGKQIAATDPEEPVAPVTDGLFAVPLDFGAEAFDGTDRWLEIRARTSFGVFTTLTPRQALAATPYALKAQIAGIANAVGWENIGNIPAGFADDSDADTTYSAGPGLELNGTVFSISDGGVDAAKLNDGIALAEILDDDGPGSGLDADQLDGLDSAVFWKLGGNSGTTTVTDFIGTTDAQPLEFYVNNLRVLRI